jgi:hypothetical protein
MDRDYDIWWAYKMHIVDEIEKGEKEMTDTQPKKFWMITGDGNAPLWYRHFNRQDAVNEASRLAKSNPGKEFFVMESVEMLTQPSGVVRHRF